MSTPRRNGNLCFTLLNMLHRDNVVKNHLNCNWFVCISVEKFTGRYQLKGLWSGFRHENFEKMTSRYSWWSVPLCGPTILVGLWDPVATMPISRLNPNKDLSIVINICYAESIDNGVLILYTKFSRNWECVPVLAHNLDKYLIFIWYQLYLICTIEFVAYGLNLILKLSLGKVNQVL